MHRPHPRSRAHPLSRQHDPDVSTAIAEDIGKAITTAFSSLSFNKQQSPSPSGPALGVPAGHSTAIADEIGISIAKTFCHLRVTQPEVFSSDVSLSSAESTIVDHDTHKDNSFDCPPEIPLSLPHTVTFSPVVVPVNFVDWDVPRASPSGFPADPLPASPTVSAPDDPDPISADLSHELQHLHVQDLMDVPVDCQDFPLADADSCPPEDTDVADYDTYSVDNTSPSSCADDDSQDFPFGRV